MGLINCPECNKEISDNAISCPHCGFSLKKPQPKRPIVLSKKILLIVISIIIVFFIVLFTVIVPAINNNSKFNEATKLIEQEDSTEDDFSEAKTLFIEVKDSKYNEICSYLKESIDMFVSNGDEERVYYLLDTIIADDTLLTETDSEYYSNYGNYSLGDLALSEGYYSNAYSIFLDLGDYEDSEQRAKEIFSSYSEEIYNNTVEYYESDLYRELSIEGIKTLFESFGDYKDSAEYVEMIEFAESLSGTYVYEASSKSNQKTYVIDGFEVNIFYNSGGSRSFTGVVKEYNGDYGLFMYDSSSDFHDMIFKKDNSEDLYYMRFYLYENDEISPVEFGGTYPRYNLIKDSDSTDNLLDPAIGMTAEEVENSTWGEPNEINKSTYSWGGTREQWCYSDYRYIYLENGIVTSIQE